MGRTSLVSLMFLAVMTVLPQLAFAQDEATVMILKLEKKDANDAVVAAVESSLTEQIEAHPEMSHKPGGALTVNDLALTAGCAKPDETCLKMLRDFVETDRVVFGTVTGSGDVHLFSLKMFDFTENRFIAQVNDQTVEGPVSDVVTIVPHVIAGFLYGNVGTMTVDIDGSVEPEIYFDGQKVGLAPTTLENLPLGQHVVTVRSGSEEYSETVVLTRDEPAGVSFSFTGTTSTSSTVTDTTEPSGGGPSVVPGIVSLAVGAVGIGVGIYGGLTVQKAKSDEEEIYAPCVNSSGDAVTPGCLPSGSSYDDVTNAGKRGQLLSFIGFGVGAVGLGLGTFLLIRALGGGESDPETANLPFDFGILPHPHGVSTSLRLRF